MCQSLGRHKQVYRRNGVLEYAIWQSYENHLEWFRLQDGAYELVIPDEDGVRSQVFPCWWLAVEALLSNQMVQVLEVLQLELASPETQRLYNS
jgi:hypothetical protein